VRLGAKQPHLMDSACLSDSGMVPQHYPKAQIRASAARWTNPGRASASFKARTHLCHLYGLQRDASAGLPVGNCKGPVPSIGRPLWASPSQTGASGGDFVLILPVAAAHFSATPPSSPREEIRVLMPRSSSTQVSVPEESDSRATGDAVHSGERHFKVICVENMARDPDRAMRV
jgi:hypothetical protein